MSEKLTKEDLEFLEQETYHWIEAKRTDSKEYKGKKFGTSMKLICYPHYGADVYSKAKIWNFKTEKWDLYSELPEERQDQRIIEILKKLPETREPLIRDLKNMRRDLRKLNYERENNHKKT